MKSIIKKNVEFKKGAEQRAKEFLLLGRTMKEKIVKIIQQMHCGYPQETIFNDWVHCMAISIQNGCCMFHNALGEKREKEYEDILKKYGNEMKYFPEMFGVLTEILSSQGMSDVLGDIYMMLDCGNKRTGQFFTPYHISQLAVQFNHFNKNEQIKMYEPSCGAGGMIIATAETMWKQGINYIRLLDVVAQDLDWRAVYMTYVQLSLLGIKAIVIQGDTLKDEKTNPECIFYTPTKMGVIL